MKAKRLERALTILFFLLGQALVYLVPAKAHGGGDLVAGPLQAGPYTVSVWVNPPQPRTQEPTHFTVGVAEPENRAAVLDAQVMVLMQLLNSDLSPISSPATTEQSINKLFYETDLNLVEPGRYLTSIEVMGPEGKGQVIFELEVKPPSPFNWFLIGLGGIVFVLVLGWLRTRRNREESVQD
jgi:hypothetical protein